MDPILTSTPKAKRTLFPEADGADSSPATVAEIAPMERPLSVEPDSAPEELGAENGPSKVLDSPITVSTTADHGVSPPAVEQPQEREKKQQPPLLQRSKMSRQLSSQDGSDSETFSSTGSDLSLDNEGRDTFDPGMS